MAEPTERELSITVIGYLRSFQNSNLETNNEIMINKLITTEDKLQTFLKLSLNCGMNCTFVLLILYLSTNTQTHK